MQSADDEIDIAAGLYLRHVGDQLMMVGGGRRQRAREAVDRRGEARHPTAEADRRTAERVAGDAVRGFRVVLGRGVHEAYRPDGDQCSAGRFQEITSIAVFSVFHFPPKKGSAFPLPGTKVSERPPALWRSRKPMRVGGI